MQNDFFDKKKIGRETLSLFFLCTLMQQYLRLTCTVCFVHSKISNAINSRVYFRQKTELILQL